MPETAPVDSLASAALLAFTGGLLDAFVYIHHGHVFASAMTGNGVLLGVALLHHDPQQAIRHVVPAIAFLAGVAASKLLQSALGSRAVTVGLALEVTTLFCLSWLPATFPQMAFTALIAFVTSYQVSSFRTVDNFSYNSTYITGNLRTIGDGFFEAVSPQSDASARRKGRRKLRDLAFIVLAFISGATLGSWSSPLRANHTLWLALPPIALVLALSRRSHRSPAVGTHST